MTLVSVERPEKQGDLIKRLRVTATRRTCHVCIQNSLRKGQFSPCHRFPLCLLPVSRCDVKLSAPFWLRYFYFSFLLPLISLLGCLKLCSWGFILSLLIKPKLSRKPRDLFISAGLSTIPPDIFLPDNTHSFLPASVTPSTWLWYVSLALSHHVYFLLVAFNLNIIGILFLLVMLLVSLLPALLLSYKLKFYLLQSPYFPSFPLFLLCLSLSTLKFLLISSPSSQWKLLCFLFFFFQKFTCLTLE